MAAELHPFPVFRDALPDPVPELSPARQRLAETSTALDRARGELEDATKPLRRLEAVTADAAALERDLGPLRQQDEAALGKWIAEGSIGARPPPSSATTLLESQLAELAPDRRATAASMPTVQAAHMAAVERLRAAAAERDAALAAVAVVAADELAGELTAAINQVLTIEARLLGLRSALIERSQAGAAEKIAATITAAKRAAGVPRDAASGPRLLEALCQDPGAKLT